MCYPLGMSEAVARLADAIDDVARTHASTAPPPRGAPLLGLEPRFDLPTADRLILASARDSR